MDEVVRQGLPDQIRVSKQPGYSLWQSAFTPWVRIRAAIALIEKNWLSVGRCSCAFLKMLLAQFIPEAIISHAGYRRFVRYLFFMA